MMHGKCFDCLKALYKCSKLEARPSGKAEGEWGQNGRWSPPLLWDGDCHILALFTDAWPPFWSMFRHKRDSIRKCSHYTLGCWRAE